MSAPLYIGLISGTSMDGIDAALVRFDDADLPTLLAARAHAYPDAVRQALAQAIAQPTQLKAPDLARLDARVGECFADATLALLEEAGCPASQITAIGSHGQTLFHGAHESPPISIQVGDPNVVAQRTRIDVVGDIRRRELTVGGQAAPLAPGLHRAIFHRAGETRAVVNLGGIGNVTVLPADTSLAVTGFDTGPANCLMDDWISHHRQRQRDDDGAWAASGRVDQDLLLRLLGDAYFSLPSPKSTGRETFNLEWLTAHLGGHEQPADVQATLAELSAVTIANALVDLEPGPERVLACGGGVHNRHLMARLQTALGDCPLDTTAAHGLDPDWVEACLLAWLARRHLQRRPGNIPTVTGASEDVVLGGLYPG